MKTNVNPFVGVGIIALVLIVLLVLLYKHNFKPAEGSMETLPPDERAKIMGHYGSQARPPANAASPTNAASPKAPGAGAPAASGSR